MKHVRESLNQFNDYKFFKMFEEDEKAELQDKEKDGLSVIEKLKGNFEEFKKNAGGEILKFKEFWEENKKSKEGFSETGDVYKLFDSDYIVGVLELPVETLSDGSIDGGMGATDEPEEEIIEGPEIESTEDSIEEPKEDFYEEATVPTTNEAEEEDEDPDLNLGLGDEEGEDLEAPIEEPAGDLEAPVETPVEEPAPEETSLEEPAPEELPVEEPVSTETPDLTAPQKYFVVYDISGDEREEIFRCGSNNVVNAFTSFYNDTFKGAMKNSILKYKEQKEAQKTEESEKKKVESDKQSKIKKFLGESQKTEINWRPVANILSIFNANMQYKIYHAIKDNEERILNLKSMDGAYRLANNFCMGNGRVCEKLARAFLKIARNTKGNEGVADTNPDYPNMDYTGIEYGGVDESLNEVESESEYEYDSEDNNEEDDYSDDNLADYEWEVGSALTAYLEDNDIKVNIDYLDYLSDVLRDKIEFIKLCMNDGTEPMDCAAMLINDDEFMKEISEIDDDFDF